MTPVLFLPLGITACGPQPKVDACKLLEKSLNDADLALVNSAQNGDTANIANTYTTSAIAYGGVSKKITNKEARGSVDQVAVRWRAAADNPSVLKADSLSMDVQRLEEYHEIMEDLSAKQTGPLNKCGYQYRLVTESNIATGGGPMDSPQSPCDQ